LFQFLSVKLLAETGGTGARTRVAWQTQQAGLVAAGEDELTRAAYGGGDDIIADDSSTNISGSTSTDTLDVE